VDLQGSQIAKDLLVARVVLQSIPVALDGLGIVLVGPAGGRVKCYWSNADQCIQHMQHTARTTIVHSTPKLIYCRKIPGESNYR
jgi:hypothetical protein